MKKSFCAALSLLLLTSCTELDDVVSAAGSAVTKAGDALKKSNPPAPAAPTPESTAVSAAPPAEAPTQVAAAPLSVPPPIAAPSVLGTDPAAVLTTLHPFDLGEEDIPKGMADTADHSVQSFVLPPPALPAPVEYRSDHTPMIAIVIDDMGLDRKRSAWAVDLPASITLSYLPYAPRIDAQVKEAKAEGHEVILHMPMQALRKGEDPGRYGLTVGMTDEQVARNTNEALDAFRGYVGVNNHMGSRFTSDRTGMNIFMSELEKRHVYFLDSKTAPTTVAEQVAREHHIPTTHRDVFIDHVETAAFVASALNHAEDVARATGSAIAIGHPKDVTLASLEAWMEGLEKRGFQIVPLSDVIKYRNNTVETAAHRHENK